MTMAASAPPAAPSPLRASTPPGAVLSEADARGTRPTETDRDTIAVVGSPASNQEAIVVGRVPPFAITQGGPAATATEIVSDVDRFLELEAEWSDAVDRAGVTHPFLTHEWLRTWWACFGGGSRSLHIVIAREDGRISGIAPLMCERTQQYGVPVRTLNLLHNDHTPRADFIIAGPADRAYAAIWSALRARDGEWDILQLSRLSQDSATRAVVERLAREANCPTGTWQGDVSPYLALTGTWDSYQASLGSKFRSNLRNRLSRLRKIGEPELEVLEDLAAIDQARADALRLEASGWKAQAGTSISSDAVVERFYVQLAERATARGWLRLLFLRVGGRRIATSYGSCYRGRLFLFKTGYDPEYATCAPFKLLTYLAIEAAYREGLVEIDFLGDAEPWKLEWTDTSRAHEWLYVFSRRKRAQLLHWMKFQVVPELKKWRA